MELTIDLASCLADIPDRRRAEGKMYGQARRDFLFSIIAMLSGARSVSTNSHADRPTARDPQCSFPAGSVAAVAGLHVGGGILQRLDPAELERAFRRHAEGLDQSCAAAPSRFIAIDGKTLRQSFDAFADRKAAHVLSAFAVDHQIILAHEVVDEKSNEIPAVQTLIAKLGLSGRVFTLDAMHCQKNLRDRPRHRQ